MSSSNENYREIDYSPQIIDGSVDYKQMVRQIVDGFKKLMLIKILVIDV